MRIFVTVGTTCFDQMIETADICASALKDHHFTFQTASGSYKPLHGDYFEFADAIDEYYDHSDIIITHAGAGSVYKLLEMRKKIIVVPNLKRVDKHQSDIAIFLEENNYALVVWDLERLSDTLNSLDDFHPSTYKKDHFFKAEEIASFVLS